MPLERRPLGRTGFDVPSLSLGTMMYGSQLDDAEANSQMDLCLERGVDFFDVAEIYPIPPVAETWGESERIVGRWMKDRGTRDRICLATKVAGRSPLMSWLRQDGSLTRLEPAQIIEAVEGSLERLQTDVIDLYQIHWPDRSLQLFGNASGGYQHYKDDYQPFDEILGTLGRLVDEGKIRYLGLSNETSWGVMRYLAEAEARGLPRMHSIQNAYSLVNRTFETDLAEVSLQESVGLLAYSPLAQGYLSGKYIDGEVPTDSRRAFVGDRLNRYTTASAEDAIRGYVGIAREHNLDPSAMALAFVLSRPWVTSAIFGASSRAQLETALGATEIEWTQELDEAVRRVHVRHTNPCP